MVKQDNENKAEYAETLNLPQTEFPMRGNLPQKEPEILARWDEMKIYQRVRQKNEGKPKFILHDGPPYANGDIHLGHALNKVLKDMIVKYKTMSGYDSPYVPGWDTHGLPIEQKAIKDLGLNRNKVSKADFRERCKEYALKYVDIQREEFRRLGVIGDWGNPYLTLMPDFEAIQLGAFGEMAKKGYIYKGLKPIYWCPDCETALAEAEIEYEDHKSASIHVKFKVKDGKGKLPDDASVIIWTTTPWTIPSNLAICLHPDFVYALLSIRGEKWLVAKDMIDLFLKEAEISDPYEIIAEFTGRDLEYLTCTHPLYDRESLLILGNHVTLEAGTGCVHTAPGHGADDFIVGKQYGLDIYSPLDDQGRLDATTGPFAGMPTDQANKAVCQALEDCGALIHFQMFTHQYPHCWRCHTPILFRATEQWFASIDGFREQVLSEIDKVKFIPSWGRERIYNMIRDRGDWCISRQRTWGVPIPIFYCDDCGEYIINDETIARLQDLFREHGSNCWFTMEEEQLLPQGFVCPKCGGHHFRKETDTMDVWFDSGSSHFAVLENPRWPELTWPADLYLEGSDQHRGWFNSSLCISVANRGLAPYRQVLTHGFLVDEEGKKQSKSLGNTISPLDIIKEMGADVLRLWVASTDYRSDIANSRNIFRQMGEAYRKIRNTLRYLLGNIYDFDIVKDQVAFAAMPELDKWAMLKLQELIVKVEEAYEDYEFHVVFHSIHKFCVLDMSAFYLDVIKDTLYTEKQDSLARRSIQTVLYRIADALTRLMAPILSYTTEEVYQYLPKPADSPESVLLLDMPQTDSSISDPALMEKWEKFLVYRDEVAKELEIARQAKTIGHSLDAMVVMQPDAEAYAILESMAADLPHLFIVSQVRLLAPDNGEGLRVSVETAPGTKCGRCWIYSESVGQDHKHPDLCQRCAHVLE
jgi:isoleucyl-tRNA synthetase